MRPRARLTGGGFVLFSLGLMLISLALQTLGESTVGAPLFLTPMFLKLGLGYSPSVAGLSMIPTVLGAMLTKAGMGRRKCHARRPAR